MTLTEVLTELVAEGRITTTKAVQFRDRYESAGQSRDDVVVGGVGGIDVTQEEINFSITETKVVLVSMNRATKELVMSNTA